MMSQLLAPGRQFMGDWFSRPLDYPTPLVNHAYRSDDSLDNPFWRCRMCNRAESESRRLVGIFWCQKCASEKRSERAEVFYAAQIEQNYPTTRPVVAIHFVSIVGPLDNHVTW